MAERFEKDRPTSGKHRKMTVYSGVRLLRQGEETQEKQGLPTVAHSSPIISLENPIARNNAQDYGQLCPSGPTRRCECGGQMTQTPAETGWVNWDCATCKRVKPERVQA